MVIWLTGCTAGLGKALVEEFSKESHIVVGGGRNQEVLEELSGTYPGSFFYQVDVADEASVVTFCERATEAAGVPDMLINNAAILNQPANLWEVPAKEFDLLTSININGVANMIRHGLPPMLKVKKGIVVNLSSGWGRSTAPEVAPYCASKWAIEGLSQALSQELPSGMASIALNPGIINTEMLQRAFGAGAEGFPTADVWAKSAAPYILGFSASDNGGGLTVPMD